MSVRRFADQLRPSRMGLRAFGHGDELPEQLAGASISPPMSESDLAAEIARIMKRPPHIATVAPAPARWLGDDADSDTVSAYLAAGDESASAEQAETQEALEQSAASEDSSGPREHEETAAPRLDAASAAAWVRKARRQRFRANMRDAASWMVSITVSLVLVAAISIAMFGWPGSAPNVERLRVRPIDMTRTLAPQASAGSSTEAVAAADVTNAR
ncbi:MAG: hypothetical protein KDJ47_02880 [Hyphomicrobiaceae bacterium]|nr:hypothetical protein [Hyphomicrobiaceae bacterium]